MGKGKLEKFADLKSLPHVFEYPYSAVQEVSFPLRGSWRADFFHNANPIVLELGCGKGEYTVELARRFPETNYIGVDIKGARMWKGATESHAEGLSNVAFLRTNIEIIDRFFAPDEVDEIWLTFPDPQMKKLTKRLTSTSFLARYARFLKDGGLVHLKTDSLFLFTYTRLLVEKNGLEAPFVVPDLYAGELPDESLGIKTYYETQWLQRGIPIKYICFRLPAHAELQEPEVEIEMDSYRSYNRLKRSGLDKAK